MMETVKLIALILVCALLIVLIVLAFKLDGTITRINLLLDDVNAKVKTLDRVFELVDTVNDKISILGDSIIGIVSGGIKRIFKDKKNKNKYKFEEEDEDE